MTLLDKARKEAKKNGKKIDPEVIKGLRAIQRMHDIISSTKSKKNKKDL